MIHTVNGSVNEQYATDEPGEGVLEPRARSMRKKAGMSTTVGSIRVKRRAKSETVLSGNRYRA